MNGLDGISAELISATRMALERQLHEAEERLRHTEQAIASFRCQEALALLQGYRDYEAGRYCVSTSFAPNDPTGKERLIVTASSDEAQWLEELMAARNQAYWCRRAIVELNRTVAVLGALIY